MLAVCASGSSLIFSKLIRNKYHTRLSHTLANLSHFASFLCEPEKNEGKNVKSILVCKLNLVLLGTGGMTRLRVKRGNLDRITATEEMLQRLAHITARANYRGN